MKNRFNDFSIDIATDEIVVNFILEILKKKDSISKKCYKNCFMIFGILASQAMMTLSDSEEFFELCLNKKLLVEICGHFEQNSSQSGIILEVL